MLAYALRVIICGSLAVLTAGAEDAGPVRVLARFSVDIGWPRWSPDGSTVGFWGNASDGLGIRVVSPDGAGLRLVTEAVAHLGVGLYGWSPDSASIVYTQYCEEGLFLHDLKSGTRRRLRGTPSAWGSPSWSPDGKTIALASSEKAFPGIFLVAVDGTEVRRLPSPTGKLWSPTWSRDGSSVLVCAEHETGARIWRTMADGSGLEEAIRLEASSGLATAWSPDGQWVVYSRSDPPEPGYPRSSGLCAVRIDGERVIRVTDHHSTLDDHPSWSPDWREIVIYRIPGGWRASPTPTHIAVIDVSRLFPDVVEAVAHRTEQESVKQP